MPKFSIPEFDKVSGTFEALPAAVYSVSITKWEQRAGKTSGQKYINWWLTVTADHPEYAGRNLFLITMLEPKDALFRLKNLCDAVKTGSSKDGFDPDQMVGAQLKVQVGQETGQNGEVQNKVVKCMKA